MPKKEFIVMPGKETATISAAVRAGDFIFVSGTLGNVDAQGNPLEGIEAQTRQCFANIKQILQAAGSSLDDVVKVTVFLVNVDDFAKMNEVYRSYFPGYRPARSTFMPRLGMPSALIEIECIAYQPQP